MDSPLYNVSTLWPLCMGIPTGICVQHSEAPTELYKHIQFTKDRDIEKPHERLCGTTRKNTRRMTMLAIKQPISR